MVQTALDAPLLVAAQLPEDLAAEVEPALHFGAGNAALVVLERLCDRFVKRARYPSNVSGSDQSRELACHAMQANSPLEGRLDPL